MSGFGFLTDGLRLPDPGPNCWMEVFGSSFYWKLG